MLAFLNVEKNKREIYILSVSNYTQNMEGGIQICLTNQTKVKLFMIWLTDQTQVKKLLYEVLT